jgi:hypothetical protein
LITDYGEDEKKLKKYSNKEKGDILMNDEEKYIFDFMNDITEEEINLIENLNIHDCDLDELQQKRIKNNVRKSIKENPNKCKKNAKKPIIAVTIVITILLGILTPFGGNAIAQIKKIIYLVPGIGKIVESSEKQFYVLSKPINYSYNDGTILVKSITKDSKSLIISLEGTDTGVLTELTIIDDKGNKYKNGHGLWGLGNGWFGKYTFYDIPESLKSFSIVVLGNEKIPIVLKNAKMYSDYAELGPSCIANGLGITIVPSKINGKIRLDLIEQISKGRKISLYGYKGVDSTDNVDVLVKDEKGKLYDFEKDSTQYTLPRSEFYFNPDKDVTKFTLEIPQVTMEYDISEEINLPIPETGEKIVNKIVKLNEFKFEITKVSRIGENFRVYVNTDYQKDKSENINIVHMNVLRNKNSEPNSSYGGYSWQLDENAVVKYYEFKVKPEDKNMIMQLRELDTNFKGPWKFDFSIK